MDQASTRTSRESINHATAIREARVADAGAITRVLESAFAEFRHLYTPEAYVATVQPESGIVTRLQEGPVWVAERGSVVVGTVSAVRAGDSVLVRGMAVSPKERSLGLGRALLELTEDFARERRCQQMSLYTTAFLRSAIRLYRSSGFEFTGETATPHGTELLRMVKTLTSTPERGEDR